MSDTSIHAFTDDALAHHDGVALAELIRNKELSASEVVAAAIERCRAVNPTVNAVAEEDFDRAIDAAKAADAKPSGVFAGVPTFIKDQLPVEGMSTRFGSHAFDTMPPGTMTADFVKQMFDMGFISLGTSTLPEFGLTASTEFPDGPPTRNPWNLGRTPGGSSGGSAVLVATGVVPIAHGADGGGSIRIPASCNGLVGLKPSRGRIVQDPAAKSMPVKIVVDGVLTRSVRDTAMYYAEAEKRYRNPKLPPIGLVDAPIDRPLRLGMLLESPTGQEIDTPTRNAMDKSSALLQSLGHEVIPMVPHLDYRFVDDFTHYWAMLAYVIRKFGKKLIHPSFDPDRLTDLTHGLANDFAAKKWKTPGVMWRLQRTAKEYAKLFNDYDVFICPVLTGIPPELGYLGMDLPYDVVFPRVEKWAGFTAYSNANGGPSISLPLGLDEETNTPIGTLFSAPLGQEKLLLQLAFQLEQAQPWRTLY